MKSFIEFINEKQPNIDESKLSHSLLAVKMRSIANKVHNTSDIGTKLDLLATGLTKLTDTKLLNTLFHGK